ncbi:PilZ domain-containing protein [Nitrosomonas sp. Nm84]|uniref:flagellar brake protein n=1 Tax=Nitrosomonas sp. Nm84 TaxID=200124 RepID=UPI000D760581|nr:flagellar brake protein [Nitrosomonas sp. Nm84]PXW87784.1 PilZ domain-containing protein [Nitrosomonas sp. Nm84]
MNLIQIQKSDLIVGQSLPWDLFDQEHRPILKRGHVIKTTDELNKLEESPLFRKESAAKQAHSGKIGLNFESMQLKVGHKLQLKLSSPAKEISGETNNSFYRTTLIGYVQDITLIVSMPASNESFLEGDQILVRLFSGKCVYSFTAYVDKIIKIPFKYLHLSFPKYILGQTIRKSRRVKCNIPASVADNPIPLTITDISATGAEIKATSLLGEPGTTIMLSFAIQILDKEVPLSIKSTIRSVKQINENGQETSCFGIEFNELESSQTFSLRSFIYQEIVENPYHAI